jgi:4-hydroxythreonine-4-phosphate dehydrogenase
MTAIGLAPGCPAGIGPEVIARAIVDADLPRGVRLLWMASAAQLFEGARRADVEAAGTDERVLLGRGKRAREVRCAVAVADDVGAASRAGVVDESALSSQRDALVRACAAAARGELHGIVTGPVRKKALVIDGTRYPGQTEVVHRFLAKDGEPPLMVFAGGPFVLGLLTVHMALHDVRAHVTAHALDVALERLREATTAIARKRKPRVVVLGVNPHAGEGGLFGREEIDVVTPAIERARARGLDVRGPVPADGFFADVARGRDHVVRRGADAVLAMFHDQGLGPYKLLVGGEGINVTWGLRVPRTSPDHGTADALAGTGTASSASMQAALALCARLAGSRVRSK